MRIGLDLRMLGGGSGISRYIKELSWQVLSMDKSNDYVLFFYDQESAKEYEVFAHKKIVTGVKHYTFQEQMKFLQILKAEKLDLVHFPHFNVPILYNDSFVVTIHDLTHTKFPGRNKSRILHRVAYNLVISHAVKASKKIIAVSESTKKEICGYFQIKAEKVQVVYEGVNKLYQVMDKDKCFSYVAQKFGIQKPYLLYVGVWRRYKNLPALAQTFDNLINHGLNYGLLLAGEEDPFYPEIKNQVLSIKNADKIKVLGRVTDEDLVNLYNGASLFVLPSLAEGFGLTTLEAANCGVPITCSDIQTLREVLGSAAEYFDPMNVVNMFDVIVGLLKNKQKLEELASAGLRRSSFYSWEKAAKDTINLYASIK